VFVFVRPETVLAWTRVPDKAGVCLFGRAFPNRLDFSGSRAIMVA
jgi:hypothetical protein